MVVEPTQAIAFGHLITDTAKHSQRAHQEARAKLPMVQGRKMRDDRYKHRYPGWLYRLTISKKKNFLPRRQTVEQGNQRSCEVFIFDAFPLPAASIPKPPGMTSE